MKKLILGIALLGTFISTILAGDTRCYVCSSYMEQCKTYVDTNKGYAHRGRCYSKCFTRLGEDGAIYRGCFDGFKEVPFLTSDYDGCKNQTWNGQTLPWCFCSGDLCNKASMADMGYGNSIDLQGGYRIEGYYHQGFQGAHKGYNTEQGGNYVQQNGAVVEATGQQASVQQGQVNYNSQQQQQVSYINENNGYAKEGVMDANGFGIKDTSSNEIESVSPNAKQNQINDKYAQNYFAQNSFIPSYYTGDYDKFHYSYQVEDPNTYVEETSPEKYIAMDESEGFKANIEPEEETKEKEVKEAPKVKKEDAKSSNEVTDNNLSTENEDIYSKTDYVYNSVPFMGAPSSYGMQQPSVYPARPQNIQQPLSYFPPYIQQQPSQQRSTGLNEDFKNNDEKKEEEEDPYYFPPHLAERIECAKTGFYQNPDDCRTFVACILDAHVRKPYMHLMRCPEGLVWDNTDKICNQFSTTCNVGGFPEGSYDSHIDEIQVQANNPVVGGTYEEQQPVVQNQQQQLKEDFIKYAGEE